MKVTLQRELQYIHQHYPGFLEQFLTAMEEGKVEGDFFGNDNCGCFYGHLFCNMTSDIIPKVWALREGLIGDRFESTPVEEFIAGVTYGDTPNTQEDLEVLKALIEEVITP